MFIKGRHHAQPLLLSLLEAPDYSDCIHSSWHLKNLRVLVKALVTEPMTGQSLSL